MYHITTAAQYDAIRLARTKPGVTEEIAAAYASHSVLSHLFNWRQSTIYDGVLKQNLLQYNISDSSLLAVHKFIIPAVEKLLTKR